MAALIDRPGAYLDRAGRTAVVDGPAQHNAHRWFGIAGDGAPACWEATGIMECSLPSSIDLVSKVPSHAAPQDVEQTVTDSWGLDAETVCARPSGNDSLGPDKDVNGEGAWC